MLKNYIEVITSRESFKCADDFLALKLSIHVQCLCSYLSCRCSHIDHL